MNRLLLPLLLTLACLGLACDMSGPTYAREYHSHDAAHEHECSKWLPGRTIFWHAEYRRGPDKIVDGNVQVESWIADCTVNNPEGL